LVRIDVQLQSNISYGNLLLLVPTDRLVDVVLVEFTKDIAQNIRGRYLNALRGAPELTARCDGGHFGRRHSCYCGLQREDRWHDALVEVTQRLQSTRFPAYAKVSLLLYEMTGRNCSDVNIGADITRLGDTHD
jgi:hypothetical protein